VNEELFIDFDKFNYVTTDFPEPRPFQSTAHDKLRAGAIAGNKSQLIMAPTGAGKTYLGMRIMHEALKQGKRALFVCDRTTLIDQTSNVADNYGLSAHGVIQASHWRTDKKYKLQIASVQTLATRGWPEADVIIIDEAHCRYKAWVDHIKQCASYVVGLSATPFTKGLGLLFSNLINAATMHQLTKEGILVPMTVFSCTRINMEGADDSKREWSDGDVASRGMEIIGDVVSEWKTYANDKKTIVFGATIEHCEAMADQFNKAGVVTEVFTCHTKPEQREVILKEYKKHDSKIRVLISVEALAKGFDVKDVECVCDCRPLRKSLSTAIQMWGRGLRSSPDTGKTECILLDFSGNIIRFREDFEAIYFNGLEALDHGEELDKTIREDKEDGEKSPCECPECGSVPFFKRCMSCGYERKITNLIEHLPGAMQEIKLGKHHAADNEFDLYKQLCTLARQSGNPDTQKQRAYYSFIDIIGRAPTWNFENTPNAPVSRAVINQVKMKKIAYAKAMQKKKAAA
jgi:DNA repair protein RadD